MPGALTRVAMAIMLIASAAHAADVDWKLYGGASVAGQELCFYEANSLVHPPDGNVRVWTKCLPKQDMDAADPESGLGRKIVADAVRKIESGYVPPIVVAKGMEFDQIADIVAYEEAASLSGIKPLSTIFYELNCAQKMLRELSIRILVKGKYSSMDEPTPWKFVPPEGNGAMLLKMLCPLR